MALKDQDRLFHSIKMKKLFPELTKSVEEEEREEERRNKERRKEKKKAERATAKEAGDNTWKSFSMHNVNFPCEKEAAAAEETAGADEDDIEYQPELTQEEREALARASVDADVLVNYNAWERMFSMEMGGCREATGEAAAGRGQAKGRGGRLDTLTEENAADAGAAASVPCTAVSGAAPLPSSSSSRAAGKAKTEKFVYERVEPMKIITVRTFKIPTSFAARHNRIRNPGFYKKVSKAVDTSDLGVAQEDMPVWEEVQVRQLFL